MPADSVLVEQALVLALVPVAQQADPRRVEARIGEKTPEAENVCLRPAIGARTPRLISIKQRTGAAKCDAEGAQLPLQTGTLSPSSRREGAVLELENVTDNTPLLQPLLEERGGVPVDERQLTR